MRRANRLRSVLGVVPAYLWFVLLLLVPLAYIVIISFCTPLAGWGFSFDFSLANYQRLADSLYAGIFAQSFVVAAYTTLLTLAIGYPFAYFLSRVSRRWRMLLLIAVELPFFVSSVIRIYGWNILLQSKGVINTFLLAIGVIDEPLSMLYTNGAVVVGTVYTLLPLMILPLYNSIEKIDPNYVAAARDLGANARQAFLTVTVRGSVPGIVSGCLMVFVPSIGLFYISDMLGGSNAVLLGNLIKSQFTESHNWPFGSALAVVMCVVTLALIALGRRVSKTDEIGVI